KQIQMALLAIAVLCIPTMLLGKPIYTIIMNKRRANLYQHFQNDHHSVNNNGDHPQNINTLENSASNHDDQINLNDMHSSH
ncbi:unnamed protein product, partial [Didymodactylos carnosus]